MSHEGGAATVPGKVRSQTIAPVLARSARTPPATTANTRSPPTATGNAVVSATCHRVWPVSRSHATSAPSRDAA